MTTTNASERAEAEIYRFIEGFRQGWGHLLKPRATSVMTQESDAATIEKFWIALESGIALLATRRPGESPGLQEKYLELIMAVSRKHHGENRHETALRYIREGEQPAAPAPAPDRVEELAARVLALESSHANLQQEFAGDMVDTAKRLAELESQLRELNPGLAGVKGGGKANPCSHPDVERIPDPSGNNDTGYRCRKCEKWVGRAEYDRAKPSPAPASTTTHSPYIEDQLAKMGVAQTAPAETVVDAANKWAERHSRIEGNGSALWFHPLMSDGGKYRGNSQIFDLNKYLQPEAVLSTFRAYLAEHLAAFTLSAPPRASVGVEEIARLLQQRWSVNHLSTGTPWDQIAKAAQEAFRSDARALLSRFDITPKEPRP